TPRSRRSSPPACGWAGRRERAERGCAARRRTPRGAGPPSTREREGAPAEGVAMRRGANRAAGMPRIVAMRTCSYQAGARAVNSALSTGKARGLPTTHGAGSRGRERGSPAGGSARGGGGGRSRDVRVGEFLRDVLDRLAVHLDVRIDEVVQRVAG